MIICSDFRTTWVADPDESHARTVVSALESQGHKLTVYANGQEAFNHLSSKLAQFAVIILDFANRPEDWKFLDQVYRLTIMCVPRPGILCLAGANWGPRVKLQVERKGARLIYERSA